MTRYPVHVGSIPAYALAEMDRINEPYRKERAMLSPDPVSEPVEPEDACRHGYMTGTFCSECPGEVASRPVSEPVDVGMSFTNRPGVGNIPTVSEPVDRCPAVNETYWQCAFKSGHQGGHHWEGPVSEPVDGLREAIDAVADALNGWDQGEEPREDTHRHWSRIVAALAAAPAEERGGLRPYVQHRPDCACRGRNAMGPACDCGLSEALAAAPAEERGGVDVDRLAYAVRLSRASTRHWNTLRDDEQAEAIARVYQSEDPR